MAGYVDIHAHGGELSLDVALAAGDEELRQASLDQRGIDLLIKTPRDVGSIEQRLFQLRARRYRVTLTASERNREFQNDPQRLEAISDHGVLLALNADSVLAPGGPARRLAERLCRSGHVQAVVFAADSTPSVSELERVEAATAAVVGKPRARWLVSEVPAAIIAGESLPPMPAVQSAPPPVDPGPPPVDPGPPPVDPGPPPVDPGPPPVDPGPPPVDPVPGSAAGGETAAEEHAVVDETLEARLPFTARLLRAVLLVPLIAVAITSFVVIRAQQGSGNTILTAQRSAQALTPGDVALVVRAAPDPKSGQEAISVRCVPQGAGYLKNPWRCRLQYANGDLLEYRVTIFPSGNYVGTHQLILAPGPPQSSQGSISGCCIQTP